MKIEDFGKRLIGIIELSKVFGISINTLYSWVNQRKIPYIKVGRLVRFDPRDIETWINGHKIDIYKQGGT